MTNYLLKEQKRAEAEDEILPDKKRPTLETRKRQNWKRVAMV
jgi:hypothetical protein